MLYNIHISVEKKSIIQKSIVDMYPAYLQSSKVLPLFHILLLVLFT